MNDPRFNSTKAQAMQLFNDNQLDMARMLYEQIEQNDPVDFDSRFMLGVIAFKAGNNTESIRFLTDAIKIRKNAPGALCQLAVVYHKAGDNASAMESLKKSINYRPDYYDAYINLLKIQSLEGLYSEIVEYCDSAIKAMPDREEFRMHRNTALELLEKQDKID